MLTHGQTYNIRLSLTNALNEVGAATVQVEVLATLRDNYQRITQTGLTPKVMISSPPSLLIYRNQSLSVFALAQYDEEKCNVSRSFSMSYSCL